jgi:acetylornithine/succinyldiaminopimelate/putrescine aminotransferase
MLTNRQMFQINLGQTSLTPLMLEIVRAEGVYMYGPGGQKYLDLISGVSVSNTGHRHPEVIEAIKSQLDNYLHLMVYGEIIQSPQVLYAGSLAEILPTDLNNVYFVNSGSEAVEGALKLAKRYTGRSRIISFRNSYHGSTHGALSIQGSETFKNSFRPLLPDIFLAGFNDVKSLELIDNNTACVILEPVQGEAGIIFPENDFLGKIRRKCDETGSLLIFDEIQTAFGRTGFMFASDRFGVIPDIMILAKALGGGMPLGAFISSKEIMSSLVSNPHLGHITTFGGHPVSCAAGLAALRVIMDENLVAGSAEKSSLFKKNLIHPLIAEVRGEGLFLAVKVTQPELIQYIISHAPDFGLILDYFLFCNDAFRIAPPLTITSEEILYSTGQIKKLLDDAIKML